MMKIRLAQKMRQKLFHKHSQQYGNSSLMYTFWQNLVPINSQA